MESSTDTYWFEPTISLKNFLGPFFLYQSVPTYTILYQPISTYTIPCQPIQTLTNQNQYKTCPDKATRALKSLWWGGWSDYSVYS